MPRSDKSSIAAGLSQGLRSAGRACGTTLGPPVERRLPPLRAYLLRGLTVFIFHEITDHPSDFQRRASIYVTPALFEQQIRWICQRFDVIAPTGLSQLGGEDPPPANAALITFDDAWAGVFRTGLPILDSLDVPCLCFINTATVDGAPDLGAVRLYQRLHGAGDGVSLDREHTLATGTSALQEIAERYGTEPRFVDFQGTTATAEDLARAAGSGPVWFGQHLHHHWDLGLIDDQLFEASLQDNARALEVYGNRLPAFAPPFGRGTPSLLPIAQRAGMRAVFAAAGGQNSSAEEPVLDRITLPTDRDTAAEWWYETHRRRILGPLARR